MDSPIDVSGARRQRVIAGFDVEGLDALLVSNPLNVTYLTGFTGEASHLVLTRTRSILVSDFRFTQQIAEECPGLETFIRPATQLIQNAVAEVLGKLALRSVGFESGYLTVGDFETLREALPTLDWKPGRDRVEKLRAVKDASEIAALRATAITMANRQVLVAIHRHGISWHLQLPDDLGGRLLAWLTEARIWGLPKPVFHGCRGPLTSMGIWKILDRYREPQSRRRRSLSRASKQPMNLVRRRAA